MKPWWVWVIGIVAILIGGFQLGKNVVSISIGFPGGMRLIPGLFLGLSIVAGGLWLAGGIGFLQLRSWGRSVLFGAATLEFVRAILSVISLFVLASLLKNQHPLFIPVAILVSILWIGGLFFFARFLRSDKVRQVMVG